MTRTNQKLAASNRKKSKNAETASAPWSNLLEDLTFLIMIRLGFIDYIAFSCVCKNWRNFALSYRNRFIAIKEPMAVGIPPYAKRSCYLFDLFDGRKFKTILPDYSGRSCVGLAHGYLIMFGRKTRDFWLVNLVTRHELEFPVLPSSAKSKPTDFRPILVFSPTLSSYLFVISFKSSREILFSLPGAAARWRRLESGSEIVDIHAFNGKIYVLHKNGDLGKMKMRRNPKLIPLELKNRPREQFKLTQMITSGEKLFVFNYNFPAFELDFDKMEWVAKNPENMTDYVLFSSELKGGALVNPNKWRDPGKHVAMLEHFLGPEKDTGEKREWVAAYEVNEGKVAAAIVWYFPEDCYEVSRLDE